MSLSKEFAQMVQEQNESVSFIHPLISGAEFSNLNQQENRCLTEYQHLLQLANTRGWHQLPDILEALHNPETAVIITDKQKKIEWVNTGFYRMTGYTFKEAAGLNPNFLQGENTSPQDISIIRNSLKHHQPFTGTLLNYRKNGEAYYCDIKIFPLLGRSKELVNFMAIENEIIGQA